MKKKKLFEKLTVKNMTIMCILIAAAVILKAFFTFYLFSPNNKLVFHNIPIMIISFVFGPIWGVIGAALTDVASMPFVAGWNIMFMLPVLLWGLVPGLLRIIFRKVNIGFIIIAESITHVCVSIANTLVFGVLYGWATAFGKVSTKELKIGFASDVFNWSQQVFNLGDVFYMRILIVVLVMLIKIPLDIMILNVINKRVLQKQFFEKEEIKYETVKMSESTTLQ